MNFSFSKRERVIFYFLISIFAAYTVYVFAYESFWVELQKVKGEIELAQQKLSAQSVLLKRFSSRAGNQKNILEKYYQKESDGSIRSKMLADLQKISSQENVRIADMKPAAIRSEGARREFPVSMMLEGGFVDMMRFFYYAESEPYGFRIQEFRFSRSFSAKSSLRCQVVLSRIFLTKE